jgi:hypothetical protein
MRYHRVLIVSGVVFVCLSIANVIVHSLGTLQVGRHKCEIYREQSGINCA